jgi:hypothetical protein
MQLIASQWDRHRGPNEKDRDRELLETSWRYNKKKWEKEGKVTCAWKINFDKETYSLKLVSYI